MTKTTPIPRNTEVISVSLPPFLFQRLESFREKLGQTRSAFIVSLIKRFIEEERWQKIYELGEKTAKKFRITSEEDIDRILHEK